MSTKAKTPGDRLCKACEYRWEDMNGRYCLFGLVNNNIESWRWE